MNYQEETENSKYNTLIHCLHKGDVQFFLITRLQSQANEFGRFPESLVKPDSFP